MESNTALALFVVGALCAVASLQQRAAARRAGGVAGLGLTPALSLFLMASTAGLMVDRGARLLAAGGPPPVTDDGLAVRLMIGGPMLACAAVAGIAVASGGQGRRREGAPGWVLLLAAGIGVVIAASGRLRLLDGQLLILAFLAALWLRQVNLRNRDGEEGEPGATGRRRKGSGTEPLVTQPGGAAPRLRLRGALWGLAAAFAASASGAGAAMAVGGEAERWLAALFPVGLALLLIVPSLSCGSDERASEQHEGAGYGALSAVCLGAGLLAVARSSAAYLGALRSARLSGLSSPFEAGAVVGEVARASPYLGGLCTALPEAVCLLLAAAAAVLAGRVSDGVREGLGGLVLGLVALVVLWRTGLMAPRFLA